MVDPPPEHRSLETIEQEKNYFINDTNHKQNSWNDTSYNAERVHGMLSFLISTCKSVVFMVYICK